MTQALKLRPDITSRGVATLAHGPTGLDEPTYAAERAGQDQRAALLISLAAAIPIGYRFASPIDLATWCMAEMTKHRAISERTRVQMNYVAGMMWTALEEAGGADQITDHGGTLLEFARLTHREFYRALRRDAEQAWSVAVAS